MNKQEWEAAAEQIKDRFAKVFGDRSPIVSLQYHENDYADNDITIDECLSIYQVEWSAPTIGGYVDVIGWQLAKVWYDPGSYHHPPDGGAEEIGEPHQRLDDCIGEAVKLYAEYAFDCFMQWLADKQAWEEEEKFV